MRKIMMLAGTVLLPLTAINAQAVDFNITAGVNLWDVSPSGYIQGKEGEDRLDVKDQLGLSGESSNQLFVQFDHFIPVIPNFRVSQTSLEFSGNTNKTVKFLGETYSGSTNTSVDLSHTDVTAYYRFLDGVTSFIPLVDLRVELGATLRMFDGSFAFEGTGAEPRSVDLTAPLPMGYLAGRVGVPFGLSAGASVNTISYSGSSLTDLTFDVRYQYDGFPLIKPGITAGYRDFSLTLDDLDDTYGDLTLDGAFFGAYIRAGF
ncbi:MAG: TIGR04219 family outer membrane beta-barrel protein [Marinospirillum sp.]|uniref:TIGR04219 family outer membrane beta-barrel protein n=1 Tax=Marinospirillum sp. TaxID=2183934 RepID=UPI0019EFFC9A|nr:TIGR04219 family outer membrane beta-barrel protein [Marinospirillum sp.]MBE0508476.1 TIGR04219 family outer membrane beta-barrel protein [Marinospirillum sp.]